YRRCVCAEKLDSAILVMKAAEKRSRCDGAEPLNRPMNRSVLAQSPMSPRLVVGGKLAKDPAQMGITEHNHVVETFPSDSAYPFCHGEPGAIGWSRMPMDRNRRATAGP